MSCSLCSCTAWVSIDISDPVPSGRQTSFLAGNQGSSPRNHARPAGRSPRGSPSSSFFRFTRHRSGRRKYLAKVVKEVATLHRRSAFGTDDGCIRHQDQILDILTALFAESRPPRSRIKGELSHWFWHIPSPISASMTYVTIRFILRQSRRIFSLRLARWSPMGTSNQACMERTSSQLKLLFTITT